MDFLISLFDSESKIFLLLFSFFLGAFVGLRREVLDPAQKAGKDSTKKKGGSFAGFRTMALITTMGALLTLFPPFPYLPVIGLLALLVFIIIAYWNGVFSLQLIGLTSESVSYTHLTLPTICSV